MATDATNVDVTGLEVNGKIVNIVSKPSQAAKLGTGTHLWDASIYLSRLLQTSQWRRSVQGASVLELGAGCGMCGIAAHHLGADFVVMTDCKEILGLTQENVSRNTEYKDASGSAIYVRELNWGQTDLPKFRNDLNTTVKTPDNSCVSFDLILGADVVFRLDLVEPLLDVIYFFASPTTTIFISLELRCTFVFEKFQQAARQRFRVMPVNPKRFTSSTNCNVRIFKLKTLT
eukprot:GHVT01007170.1.p1 GENE.GHVT01007170.1~~GHVT01007170.1.p1  ORF type:complete len:231 (-),score=7.50 GHVT01007170.1:155-847(-)